MKFNIAKITGLFVLASVLLISGCGDDNPTNGNGGEELEIPAVYRDLPGTLISEDETWSTDTTLTGPRFVLPGVTLTVEEGVEVSFTYHNGNNEEVGTIITLPADAEN